MTGSKVITCQRGCWTKQFQRARVWNLCGNDGQQTGVGMGEEQR